jgi:hypothetical protein
MAPGKRNRPVKEICCRALIDCGIAAMITFVVIVQLKIPNVYAVENQRTEREVSTAVRTFYGFFNRQDFEKMWTMLSKGIKDGNDGSKTKYVEDLRRANRIILKATIRNVKFDGNRASVIVLIRSRERQRMPWFSELHRDTWILEQGKWLYDGSITLKEPLRIHKA